MINWLDFKSIKRGVTLESVLRHYQVKLRRSGKDQYRGCCPIHRGDGRDAFHVNLARNVFHCFSCGAGGTVLDFVAAMEGCSLFDAAQRLQCHDVLVDPVDLDTEWEGTGYGKKKGFFTPELQADWHRLRASLSGRARDYRKDSGRVWRWFLRGARTDAWAIGHSYPQC